MADANAHFTPWSKGTPVEWDWRGAVEHGYVESFDGTYYHVRQIDNHVVSPGPRVVVYKHLPSALRRSTRSAVESAAKQAEARRAKHSSRQGAILMAAADNKPDFTPRKRGEHVHWPYRSGIGDGIIEGVDKLGESDATTRYLVRELDHHTGEKSILKHYGAVLKSGWDHH